MVIRNILLILLTTFDGQNLFTLENDPNYPIALASVACTEVGRTMCDSLCINQIDTSHYSEKPNQLNMMNIDRRFPGSRVLVRI